MKKQSKTKSAFNAGVEAVVEFIESKRAEIRAQKDKTKMNGSDWNVLAIEGLAIRFLLENIRAEFGIKGDTKWTKKSLSK